MRGIFVNINDLLAVIVYEANSEKFVIDTNRSY